MNVGHKIFSMANVIRISASLSDFCHARNLIPYAFILDKILKCSFFLSGNHNTGDKC